MTAQLKHMILGRRSGTLREAKPTSNRPAVVRRGRVEVDHGLYGPGALGPWLRDGSPIAGQTTPAYTPTAADVGHQIACRATVTYPLPFQVTANATSPAITIRAALSPPPSPTPVLTALNDSPRTFTLRGHRVGGRCQPATRSDRRHHPCARRATLTVRFTLNTAATVIIAIERALPGLAGVNAFPLPAAIGGHTLEPGSYRLRRVH
jgi:hypothetical protein